MRQHRHWNGVKDGCWKVRSLLPKTGRCSSIPIQFPPIALPFSKTSLHRSSFIHSCPHPTYLWAWRAGSGSGVQPRMSLEYNYECRVCAGRNMERKDMNTGQEEEEKAVLLKHLALYIFTSSVCLMSWTQPKCKQTAWINVYGLFIYIFWHLRRSWASLAVLQQSLPIYKLHKLTGWKSSKSAHFIHHVLLVA